MAKLAAILGNRLTSHFGEGPSVFREYINRSYIEAVMNAGGVPLLLPCYDQPEQLYTALEKADCLLVSGGVDIDPAFYGQQPAPLMGDWDPQLDANALWAMQYAVKNHLPVLGICRGLQLINVAFGGTLHQDLSYKEGERLLHVQHGSRDKYCHTVTLTPGSILQELYGTDVIRVNSLHHQAIRQLGQGLAVSAVAPDGVIEGIETQDGAVVGVQWHPEELTQKDPRTCRLFEYWLGQ